MTRARVTLRKALPVVVSAAILIFLATQLDLRTAVAAVDLRAASFLGAALVVYAALTLALEAISLARLLPVGGLGPAVTMRIKAASYLLGVLHYTVGMGALTVLLRRRAGITLGRAAGVVLLISAFDLGVLIALCLTSVTLLGTEAAGVRLSVVAGAALAMTGGFLAVRTPRSLGPLDRLRSLSLFQALATTPLRRLGELVAWRTLFVVTFVGLVGTALRAFGIHVSAGDLFIGVTVVSLVATLPIAFAGLGTGQAAFLYAFRNYAEPEILLACSLLLSSGIILVRGATGLLFAREYAREAQALAHAEAVGPEAA